MPLREVNGVQLLVEDSGSGEPVVLVHGSWDDRHTWGLVEPELARRFRVVSYDRRGHSGSEDGAGTDSRAEDEDDLGALIEALEITPAHVVGNSFGGSIALGLAARRPELFRTLSVHEPPLVSLARGDPDVARVGEAIGRVVQLIERGEEETAAHDFVEDIALGPGSWELLPQEERDTMITNARTFAGEASDPYWADIDLDSLSGAAVKVLLTQGDQSPPFFSKVIAQLADAMKAAHVRTLPGAGHVPHVTHAGDYVAVVNEFLAD